MEWIYEKNEDNSARYVLGTLGDNPLVCFGINPSTAEPNKLDPTVRRVQLVSEFTGHDSFIMFNVYPQRATDPKNLHLTADMEIVKVNEMFVSKVVGGRRLKIWAAWGNLIEFRAYLLMLRDRIMHLPGLINAEWVKRGPLTSKGHPRHPLYSRNDWEFEVFPCAVSSILPIWQQQ